jgi:hypothetical protein
MLSGCDQLGIEDPAKVAAIREADGKAIGSACRQTGRAIEDCFALNPRAQKSAVFAGWREMDGYMRENKLESVPRQLPDAAAKGAEAPASKGAGADTKGASGEKPAEAPAEKSADKLTTKSPEKLAVKPAAKH